MTSTDQLIVQFKDDWAAGERPLIDALLAAIPERCERERARRLLENYLADAPTPAYPPPTLARLESEPGVQRAVNLFDDAPEPAGPLIRRLRWQRHLRLDQLADALIVTLRLPPKPDKLKRHLHDLENGLIDAAALSRSLIHALAAILDTTPQILDRAGRAVGAAGDSAAPVYRRSYEQQPPFSAIPRGYTPATEPGDADDDEIDELFGRR